MERVHPTTRVAIALAVSLLGAGACGGGGEGGRASPARLESGLDVRPVSDSCIAPPRQLPTEGIGLKPVYPGVHVPKTVALVQAPGEASHWYAVIQTGYVARFDAIDSAESATPFADFSSFIQGPDVQESIGLLGMAFHPRYAENRLAFFYYTVADPSAPIGTSVVVARVAARPDGTALDMGSRRELLRIGLKSHEHNGGTLGFGLDGFLYVGVGEGGPGEDPTDAAQRLDTLLGKMLRLDVDAGDPRGYGIPADNPYASGGGLPEIWARGLRNPWKWSFDRATGELWLGDVGWHAREEIDVVRSGGNYGWPVLEGTLCQRAPCDAEPFDAPAVELDHSRAAAITGGYVYRGSAIPELAGSYLFGDYVSGRIFRFEPGAPPSSARLVVESARALATFAEDAAGELYVVDWATGDIARVVMGGDSGASAVATTLSRTGCADRATPVLPALGMLPYDVNVALWSDGATKTRWLALPEHASAAVSGDGDWSFPIGTVLRKDFRLGERLVETRLFMHHDDGAGRLDDGWAGYSYRWTEDQKEAVLLPAGQVEALPGGGSWTFPSGGDCLRCHTHAAGRTLGPTTRQLDRDFAYPEPGRTANQVETLEVLGMVARGTAAMRDPASAPAGAAPVRPFPDLGDDSQAAGSRARAYLDVNCAHCHRPGGPGGGPADFRGTVSFAEMGVCDAAPADDFGIPDARLLKPGARAKSTLWLRLTATDSRRMPPLATAVVDQQAAEVIGSWIDSLGGCP